jgi:hypothetical protein
LPLRDTKNPIEAFISASSGNPLSWLSPRRLRVNTDQFLKEAELGFSFGSGGGRTQMKVADKKSRWLELE